MEAASNLTATCSSTALGRDVAWKRIGCPGAGCGPSGGVSAKRTGKRAVRKPGKIHSTLNPGSTFVATKAVKLPKDARQSLRQILGDEARAEARAAAPCSQTAAEAASNAGMPCAARPQTKPVRTSPDPAVARVGGRSQPIEARPSGAATTVSEPLMRRPRRSAAPRREPVRACRPQAPRPSRRRTALRIRPRAAS